MVQTLENPPLWVDLYNDQNCQFHPEEPKLLKYIKEVHVRPNGSKEQERAIQRILNTLFCSGLIRIPNHPDALEAQSQTYRWLANPIIVLLPQLLQAVETFCSNEENQSDRVLRLQNYLSIIQAHNPKNTDPKAVKDYRNAQKNFRVNLEALLEERTEADRQAKQCLVSAIHREPRIKSFCSYPPDSVADRLASWIRSYFNQRISDLYRNKGSNSRIADCSLDVPLDGEDSNGDSFLDLIGNRSQPWQDALTFDQISKSNNLLGELSQAEEAERLERLINQEPNIDGSLDSPHVAEYPECTCRTIAQRLILKERPDRLQTIAQDYGIPFKVFYLALLGTFAKIEQVSADLGIEPQQPWRTQPELRAEMLRGYIIADPDNWLSESLNQQGNYPTGQQVAYRLFLKEPPDSIQAIAEEFQILGPQGQAPANFYNAISGTARYPDINQSRWGLLDRLVGYLVEYYPQPNRLREAIKKDAHNLLKSCRYSENYPNCNAQFMALHCLKLLDNFQSFDEIAKQLSKPGKRVKPESLKNFWYARCLPRIGRLITILDGKDNSKKSPTGGQHE